VKKVESAQKFKRVNWINE